MTPLAQLSATCRNRMAIETVHKHYASCCTQQSHILSHTAKVASDVTPLSLEDSFHQVVKII